MTYADSADCSRRNRAAVLVVEDEVIIRILLSEKLRRAGYTVLEAVTADEALSIVAADAKIGLIITDVRMPGSIDGSGLARIVRAEFPAVKIVVTTAHVPASEVGDVDGYFEKPYEPTRVLERVKSLLE